MTLRSQLLACVLASVVTGEPVCASSADGVGGRLIRESATEAVVTWSTVIVPPGRIVLLDDGRGICQLRLSAAYHRGDANPPATFHGGRVSVIVQYDWRYQAHSTATPAKVTRGTGVLTTKDPFAQVHGLEGGGGNGRMKCGTISTRWYPDSALEYGQDYGCTKPKLKIAPTSWREFEEVQPEDSRLKWFECQPNRDPIVLPLEPK